MEDLCTNKNINPKVISIVSTKSGMGKTTLIEGVIKVLKQKNYKVGVLKHDAHNFEIDKEGKDSYRFTKAGADNVIINSSQKLAMVQILKEQKKVEDILKLFVGVDVVIIEGFKNNKYPKIEVHRNGIDNRLLCEDNNFDSSTFIAIASDEKLDKDIPILNINNHYQIAEFIVKSILK
ncbi:molybdopterin-guanine dinucleotide biosynthesis protein B [Haloimpatiens sp. FM7330]|uniref:molybdopterin-guanine dinucleotide biosynthesis protein B n=1 Tax=Haloimpatiens sp. FM7330 TaxID=3298610 RepID=UPI00362B061F